MYCPNPLAPQPAFPYLGTPGALVAEARAFDVVQTHFEMAGEILDLPFEGRILKVLNVLRCINCLDHKKCKWVTDADGKRLFPRGTGYAFRPERFDVSSIFKIPERHKSLVFCWERDGDPEEEFKAAVEKHKLTGLKFVLRWSSD
jgi:hypothetical protein